MLRIAEPERVLGITDCFKNDVSLLHIVCTNNVTSDADTTNTGGSEWNVLNIENVYARAM